MIIRNPRPETLRRLLAVLIGTAIISHVASVGWDIYSSRQTQRKTVEDRLLGNARALQEHAAVTFSSAEGTLDHIASDLAERRDLAKFSKAELQQLVSQQAKYFEYVSSILIVDRHGKMIANSLGLSVVAKNIHVGDRDYFLHHQQNPGNSEMYISRTYKNRLRADWRFFITRSLVDSAGAFDGLIAIAVDPNYFNRFYSSLRFTPGIRLLLLRRDGFGLMQTPFNADVFSQDYRQKPLFREHLPKTSEGVYFSSARGHDGLRHYVGFRGLLRYPIVAVASQDEKDAFAFWRRKAWERGAAGVLLLAFIAMLGAMVRRYLKEFSESESRYRNLFENAAVAMVHYRADGAVLRANAAFARMLGYASADEAVLALEQPFARLFAAADDLARVIVSASESRGWTVQECRLLTASGAVLPVLVNFRSVSDDSGQYFEAYIENLTEKRRLEEQLFHAQRMESVGLLAGGVAHDFNNILTIIKGNVEICRDEITPDAPLAHNVDQVAKAVERAVSLTRSLLAFSRRQAVDLNPVCLDETLLQSAKLLRRLLSEDVTLELQLGSSDLRVLADVAQVDQVLMNLIVNARDAMPTGGKIQLVAEKVNVDAATAAAKDAQPGEYARISVRDTGTGIKPEHLPHIFEPFFTTKERGKGTGLGLAVVYGIVRQHRGFSTVDSEAGRGTCFSCYFPISDLRTAQPELAPAPVKVVGEASILLVEDDVQVLEVTRKMLEGRGFKIVAAADPLKAIEIFSRDVNRFDIVVSDIVMPKMTGLALRDALRQIKPGVKVLFISGYAFDALREKGLDVGGEKLPLLQKPFDSVQLTERINELVSSRA